MTERDEMFVASNDFREGDKLIAIERQYNAMCAALRKELSKREITQSPQAALMLASLSITGWVNGTKRLDYFGSNASYVIGKLVASGFVTKNKLVGDGRVYRYTITRSGRTLAGAIRLAIDAASQALGYSNAEG